MRILVGITEIAGYYAALAPALRRRGHLVRCVITKPRNPGYDDPENTGFPALVTEWCQRLGEIRNRSLVHKVYWKVMTGAVRIVVLLWALFTCEVFVFGFGRSLLPLNLDLPLLKLFGKKILFVCHGSDSRPSYLDYGSVLDLKGDRRTLRKTRRDTKVRRANVRRMDRWSDWIVENPFSSHFHSRRLVNWYIVGMPCTLPEAIPPEPEAGIKILHAPSSPLFKGTARIQEAVTRVQLEIPGLEMVTITGKPHGEVLAAIRTCHFVIDQLYSDTPCAGFAAEAAACGRPTIVGGFGWSPEWLQMSRLGEWPSLVCREEELEDAIRRMALDAGLRRNIAEAAIRRAQDWSDDHVAERIECILESRAPEDWYFDPAEIPVFYSGGGLPEDTVRKVIGELIAWKGKEVLALRHQPRLERMAVEFAGSAGALPHTPGEG